MNTKPMIVSPAEAGMPLDIFLARRLKTSRKQAKRLLDDRLVFVNRRRVWMARHPLEPKDEVEIQAAVGVNSFKDVPIPILYRDADFVIANKPPGLPANGKRSVEELLRRTLDQPSLEAVHRLDRDTSGCLWFALNAAGRETAVALFKEREVVKTYHAIVEGRVRAEGATITTPLDGQSATTHVQVLSSRPWASHVKILIETGRTHQIRKHLASIRHPVLGDKSYLTRELAGDRLRQAPRQMLHASGLAFRHPETGQTQRIKAPLPGDFKRMLGALGLSE
jgi:RluA family pseudouridine synthase